MPETKTLLTFASTDFDTAMVFSGDLLYAETSSLLRSAILSPDNDLPSPEEISATLPKETDDRHALELTFRYLAIEQCSARLSSSDLYIVLDRLLKLSVNAVEADTLGPQVPSMIVTDSLNTSTVEECFHTVFTIIEAYTDVWKSTIFFAASKNNLLRACNDLLKRVCRVHMTKFCGRIQIFLARLYPITEKSALNLTSAFNQERISDHVTAAKSEEDDEDEKETTNRISDHFNTLQSFLIDPSSAMRRWDAFMDSLNYVLDCFYSYKLAPEQCLRNQEHRPANASTFTNENDLDTQMSDPLFRQQFLIQVMIACRYFTDPVKFRTDDLVKEKSDEIGRAFRRCCELLSECSEDPQLGQTVASLLDRECRTWNEWKNGGCPASAMELEPGDATPRKRKHSIDPQQTPIPVPLTKTRVQRQQECENVLRTIGQQQQSFWSTEQTPIQELTASPDFFDSALKNFDLKAKPSDFIAPDETWSWRALRLARSTRTSFSPSAQNSRKVNDFLFHVLEKMKTRQINRESAKLVAKDPPILVVSQHSQVMAPNPPMPQTEKTPMIEESRTVEEETLPVDDNGATTEDE
ncbi:hypothetical protein ACOME3_007353 [Neoechinorhynchus agilis]